jgi:hypothetical protein
MRRKETGDGEEGDRRWGGRRQEMGRKETGDGEEGDRRWGGVRREMGKRKSDTVWEEMEMVGVEKDMGETDIGRKETEMGSKGVSELGI